MRTTCLLISAAMALFWVPAARADLLYYDSFDYAVQNGTQAANTASGNTLGVNYPTTPGAAMPPWFIYQSGNSSPYVGSGSLSYPNLAVDPNPSSNNASYRGNTGSGDNYHFFNQPATWDGTSQPPFTSYPQNPATSTTLYYSMLLQVNQIGTIDEWKQPDANFPNGQFLTGFTDVTSISQQTAQGNTSGALLIKSSDGGNTTTTYQLGIGTTGRSVGTFPATTFGLGQTVFVVVAYAMNPGTNTDVATLYINPTPGSLELDNVAAAQTPAGSAETGALTGFVLKDDQHLPDNGLEIDELRIGTTWADVTPAAAPSPEPATLSLLAVPTLLALSRRRRCA